jgi:protein-S-isoprenylcysteine O-methyltransferase Ste14
MIRIYKASNGMNIIGQGGKIILFTLPFLTATILIHLHSPNFSSLPSEWGFIQPLGYVLLVPGTLLWISGIIQLLMDFPKGKLITHGVYGICRNPIYSSFILLILPAISILTLTWVYLCVSIFLYIGVTLFIGKEEKQLLQVFGEDYANYLKNVNRIIPFIKPLNR